MAALQAYSKNAVAENNVKQSEYFEDAILGEE